MIFRLAALIGVALLTPTIASENEVLLDDLRESLEKNVNSEMAPLFRSDLKDSGLSSSDMERIVADLEDEAVACFLDSLIEHARNHDISPAELISEFDGELAIGPIGDDFALLLNSCLNAARLEAGISGLDLE